MSGCLEGFTKIGSAPTLPDDGIVQRLASALVPQQGGLALVGDTNGNNVRWFTDVLSKNRANPPSLPIARYQLGGVQPNLALGRSGETRN